MIGGLVVDDDAWPVEGLAPGRYPVAQRPLTYDITDDHLPVPDVVNLGVDALDPLLHVESDAIGDLDVELIDREAVPAREDPGAEHVESLREQKSGQIHEETLAVKGAERDLVIVSEALGGDLELRRRSQTVHHVHVAQHSLGQNLTMVAGRVDLLAVREHAPPLDDV